jgi:hypothetical protein
VQVIPLDIVKLPNIALAELVHDPLNPVKTRFLILDAPKVTVSEPAEI